MASNQIDISQGKHSNSNQMQNRSLLELQRDYFVRKIKTQVRHWISSRHCSELSTAGLLHSCPLNSYNSIDPKQLQYDSMKPIIAKKHFLVRPTSSPRAVCLINDLSRHRNRQLFKTIKCNSHDFCKETRSTAKNTIAGPQEHDDQISCEWSAAPSLQVEHTTL